MCVGKVFDPVYSCLGLPHWLSGKESTCHAGDMGSIWVRKIPWRKKWQSPLEFLPGKSHGQRSLAGYSPQGRRVGHDLTIKLTLTHSLFFSFSLSLLFFRFNLPSVFLFPELTARRQKGAEVRSRWLSRMTFYSTSLPSLISSCLE